MIPANGSDDFAKPIRERFQKEGITPQDVEKAIK